MAFYLESKAAEQYLSDVRITKKEYAKLFGDIESICDANLKLRLQRMEVYITAKQSNDSPALWNAITSLVGDDGTDLVPSERKFRADQVSNQSTKCILGSGKVDPTKSNRLD